MTYDQQQLINQFAHLCYVLGEELVMREFHKAMLKYEEPCVLLAAKRERIGDD